MRIAFVPVFVLSAAAFASCGLVDKVEKIVGTCSDACTKIQECDATPPTPSFGNFGASSTGQGGIDCAAGCSADDAALNGYSACQIDCIVNSECGLVQDCWKPSSDTYAQFCLADVEVPDVAPPADEPPPANNTNTGNEEVDVIIEDPAVAIAVDDAADEGFEVNYGDQPPQLVGKYDVSGKIDASSNARPVGSPIQTSICFWDYTQGEGGVYVSYCEDGVPGEDSAPLTGSNNAFTAYFEYEGAATVLFSGSMNEDGTLSQVEALVVYAYATDVWELSHTDWTPAGECNSCN